MHTLPTRHAKRAFVCLIAIVTASCSGGDKPPVEDHVGSTAKDDWRAMPSAARPLDGGASSERALLDTVLSSFATRDTAALHAMLIDRNEFVDIVYPELGMHYSAARDTRQETKDFLWDNQYLNARKGMFKALREVGGRKLSLVDVRYADGDKRFRTYQLHEGTELTVKAEDGKEATLLALGSIIERDGRFKLLSYRDID